MPGKIAQCNVFLVMQSICLLIKSRSGKYLGKQKNMCGKVAPPHIFQFNVFHLSSYQKSIWGKMGKQNNQVSKLSRAFFIKCIPPVFLSKNNVVKIRANKKNPRFKVVPGKFFFNVMYSTSLPI